MSTNARKFRLALTTLTLVAVVLAMVAGGVWAGQFGLDRNSSDVVLDPGSLNTAGGNFVTTAPWDVNTGFQISLMGEEQGPPTNDEWNFNHYDGGGTYDWTNHNFADYPYYHLKIDSTGNIPASFYTDGPTGELLEWALYYTDSSLAVQTVFGGTIENPTIDGSGNFSAFLRIVPAMTYRTFDGTGEGFVNTVEIWGGEGKLTDLMGYQISQAGTVAGDTWTASGDITLQATLLDTRVWNKYSGNPVVTGSMAFDPCVIKDGPNDYKMWYTHVDGGWTIYYADSTDGINWANHQQVLAPFGTGWEESRVLGPSVINDGGTYKMWYGGMDTNYVYTIGYATSPDGIAWAKVSQVLDVGAHGTWDSHMVREPWVIKDGSDYKMWYAGTSNWPQFEIGYATSSDGTTWTKHASNPVFSGTPGGWDGFQVYAPSVVKDGGTYHMYFSGTDNSMSQRWSTGYATSSDGISWTEGYRNPILIPDVPDDSLDYVSVMNDGGAWKMWYSYGGTYAIGLATLDGSTELYLDPAVASIPNDNATTQQFTVRIANAADMYGYQFVVTFDPANLEATAAAFDTSFFDSPQTSPPAWNATIDNTNGKVYFAKYRQNPQSAVSGSGPLATVTFKSKSGATPEQYKIDFEQVILGDIDGNALSCDDQYAWLTLYGTGTLQGSVDLQGRSDESGGTVTIVSSAGYTESKTITDSGGSWSFTGIPAGSYQVNIEMARYLDAQKGQYGYGGYVTVSAGGTTTLNQVKLLGGDCNDSDGPSPCGPPYGININDATILGGAFGSTTGGPGWNPLADINDSGNVNILDAVLLGGNWHKCSPVPWS